MHLLEAADLNQIFSSYRLLEKNSFYIIDPVTKTYQTDLQFSSLVEYNKYIQKMYESGRTIIVKNLENFNLKIKQQCLNFKSHVDVHMYLVPNNGIDSFGFHTDEKDVFIKMVYGRKTFETKVDQKVHIYELSQGDELYIDQGVEHRAIARGASCLLSFGYTKSIDYFVPGGIFHNEVQTNQVNP